MFRDNTAWQAEERKVTQHLGGSPGDEECRTGHTRSLVTVQHTYPCPYVCMYVYNFFLGGIVF